MNNISYPFIALLLVLIFPFATGHAAETNPAAEHEDFFDLDLSKLANIVVTIASTHEEPIQNTPAVVSRYNADEMSKLGLRTLKDMLSFIPGVLVQDSPLGSNPIMMRGIVEAFNQKVLFLVDDVPYFMPAHSDIPLLGIPLAAISHVEVIRGPGAVYYGTNASAGVINVVTRKHAGYSLSAVAGSHNVFNTTGRIATGSKDGLKLSLAFEVQNERGYPGRFENFEAPPSYPADTPSSGDVRRKEGFRSVLGQAQLGGLHFMGQAQRTQRTGLSSPWSLINQSELEDTGYLAHLKYIRQLDRTRVHVYTDYNLFYPKIRIDNFLGGVADGSALFSNNGRDNSRWRSGADVDYAATEAVRFFAGIEHERRSTGSYNIVDDETQSVARTIIDDAVMRESSLFAQADYTSNSVRFLLGGRYVDNTFSGDSFTPRGSVIYQIDPRQTVKLLYAVGFNSPNFIQVGANASGLVTSAPNLVAETVKTTDLAYTLATAKTLLVANIYYLQAEDFILRERPDGVITFFNADNFERYGAELDFQRQGDRWKLFGNMSYHHQGNTQDEKDHTAIVAPNITVATGGHYELTPNHSLGGALRVVGPRGPAPTLSLVDLNYSYTRGRIALFANVRNLLDEVIHHPDVQNFADAALVPGGDGTGLLVGVEFRK